MTSEAILHEGEIADAVIEKLCINYHPILSEYTLLPQIGMSRELSSGKEP